MLLSSVVSSALDGWSGPYHTVAFTSEDLFLVPNIDWVGLELFHSALIQNLIHDHQAGKVVCANSTLNVPTHYHLSTLHIHIYLQTSSLTYASWLILLSLLRERLTSWQCVSSNATHCKTDSCKLMPGTAQGYDNHRVTSTWHGVTSAPLHHHFLVEKSLVSTLWSWWTPPP